MHVALIKYTSSQHYRSHHDCSVYLTNSQCLTESRDRYTYIFHSKYISRMEGRAISHLVQLHPTWSQREGNLDAEKLVSGLLYGGGESEERTETGDYHTRAAGPWRHLVEPLV